MRSLKAVYEDGQVLFLKGQTPEGRMDVIVTFLDSGNVAEKPKKNAGKRFVEKWTGVIKGADIDGWKDRKAEDLLEKHK